MNRREFLGSAMTGLAAFAAAGATGAAGAAQPCASAKKPCKFKLGVAGYTYYSFSLDDTLAQLEKFDLHGLCAKDKHFPLALSEKELGALVKKCADHGVEIYGAGPLNVASEEEARKTFAYCAALGVKTVVGVPWEPAADGSTAWGKRRASRKLCEFCAKLCAEYDVKFAIHNHGRNPKTGSPDLYGAPEDTWNFVKDLDPRMGICFDVAYTRADGFDPAAEIRKYASRLFDLHLRNTSDVGNGSSGTLAHLGKVDYVSVVRALKDVGYAGWCGIEMNAAFNKPNVDNPGADPSWIPQYAGYFRGLMDAV